MFSREQMLDSGGRPLTQSLFLEIGYGQEALYTLKEVDHTHNGKVFPSLKRLYLEMNDPTEYEFATTYLLGWKHWQRLCENKVLRKHIDEWRDELEVKIRCAAIKQTILASKSPQGGFQASKWLADRGWSTRGAGRPTKGEMERERKIQESISSEFSDDVVRMLPLRKVE